MMSTCILLKSDKNPISSVPTLTLLIFANHGILIDDSHCHLAKPVPKSRFILSSHSLFSSSVHILPINSINLRMPHQEQRTRNNYFKIWHHTPEQRKSTYTYTIPHTIQINCCGFISGFHGTLMKNGGCLWCSSRLVHIASSHSIACARVFVYYQHYKIQHHYRNLTFFYTLEMKISPSVLVSAKIAFCS